MIVPFDFCRITMGWINGLFPATLISINHPTWMELPVALTTNLSQPQLLRR